MTFAQSIILMFVQPLLLLIFYVMIAYVIMSWLFTLNIIPANNPTGRRIYSLLASVVEPICAPFRKIIPPMGGFDLAFLFAAMTLLWINNYLIPSVVLPALG